jgi:hypothetical protein
MIKPSKENILISVLIFAKVLMHTYSNLVSGYHWDEFLHIESGKHLAWGFTDFPPMIGLIAWIQNLLDSESLIINRLFINLVGVFTLIVTAKIIKKLGGGFHAILIALLCLLFSPIIGTYHTGFLPSGFSHFFQLLVIYYLICFYTDKKDNYLYHASIAMALGFMTKYLVGYLILSMFLSVTIFDRTLYKNKTFWKAIVLFLLIILPNLIWQINHNFPLLDHISALVATDLNNTSLLSELASLALLFNPIILIISIIGIITFSFCKVHKSMRMIGIILLLLFLIIILTNGKFYYLLPALIPAISLGAISIENWIRSNKYAVSAIALSIIISGILLVPLGMPFFKPEKFVELYKIKKLEDDRTPIAFQHFYSQNIWPQVLNEFKTIIEGLPDSEKDKCIIWGKHYGHIGFVDLYREEYGLPLAINHMGSYHDWIPELHKKAVYITTGEINLTPNFWLQFFDDVEEVSMIQNKYATDYQHSGIRFYICRGLKYSSTEIKQIINKYDF